MNDGMLTELGVSERDRVWIGRDGWRWRWRTDLSGGPGWYWYRHGCGLTWIGPAQRPIVDAECGPFRQFPEGCCWRTGKRKDECRCDETDWGHNYYPN